MTDYDNKGQAALWGNKEKFSETGGKAPILRGNVTAHRDIRAGEELDLGFWPNESDNPKAPRFKGKLTDKFNSRGDQGVQNSAPASQSGDDYDDDIPF